ncbi:MAG: TonB-dependent receptor, partial [Parahaliea sp.]
MKPRTFLRLALGAPVAVAIATPSYAALTLEEVVVTARKKEESIQDVPVAVTAIAGGDIEQAFTLDTTGLQAFAPNVVFDTIEMGTPGGGGFSIRGISYQDVDKGFDPTVLVSVDDVPLATGTGQVFDMIDIERIEVLRGPQGTLFGKNVVGGLINIHRVKPQLGEHSGKVRARYGDYEKAQADFLYNYGEDSWAVKLTGGLSDQGEGYVDNTEGGDLWYRKTQHFGVALLWAPNDTTTVEVMYDYNNLEGEPGAVFNVSAPNDAFCQVGALYGVTRQQCTEAGESGTGSRDTAAADTRQWNELEKHQFTARIITDITDDHTVTYVGSLMKSDDDQGLDGDGQNLPIYHFRRWGDFEQFTHELRLSRDTGSILTWQVGLFSAYAEGTNNQTSRVLFPPLSRNYGRTTSDSYSVFGEADLALLDERLVLTGGLRYIHETKKLDSTSWALADDPTSVVVGPNAGGSTTASKNIYRVGARYHFNDDIMAYFTTSTGFRSGGLSPRALDAEYISQGYKPEELTNYEVGLRTTLFNGSLILNLTAFTMDYDDMQIELAIPSQTPPGTQNFVVNAGKASIQGVE